MSRFIKNIEIENFKSFKTQKITDLKRINLFIGKPNVGKSNFLEALSLFGLSYCQNFYKLNNLIRLENEFEFFYDGINQKALIKIEYANSNYTCEVSYEKNEGLNFIFKENYLLLPISNNIFLNTKFKTNLSFLSETRYSSSTEAKFVKTYHYNSKVVFKSNKTDFLSPIYGENIVEVLEFHPNLRKIFESWFNQYGLRLVLDKVSQSLKIMKDKGDEGIFLLPYSSIADTLQRIIFYKTAIASNENSVLIFEEPEAHAFPPYIVEFTQDVIQSKTNQFFIATHSPIVVNDFLENARDELAIFMVDFKDGQTVMRGLSHDEIEEVYKYGVDLFFNYENYLA